MTPVAITFQNSRWTARDGCGRPGDRIGGRTARPTRHCRHAPSGTSPIFMLQCEVATTRTTLQIRVLRRPLESALTARIAVTHEPGQVADAYDNALTE